MKNTCFIIWKRFSGPHPGREAFHTAGHDAGRGVVCESH
ncbi:hypothetical protein HNR65_001436 [Desulfosalsimonas propionicica]|uniref:Uncharacterized protein n=1 Tax=Desulfosalsimonas propionicica TaxID=332175 RepID=A0A7W0C8M0_9BACT|nr:hypothetical protein [Desulfosalsimonas propionicica]